MGRKKVLEPRLNIRTKNVYLSDVEWEQLEKQVVDRQLKDVTALLRDQFKLKNQLI